MVLNIFVLYLLIILFNVLVWEVMWKIVIRKNKLSWVFTNLNGCRFTIFCCWFISCCIWISNNIIIIQSISFSKWWGLFYNQNRLYSNIELNYCHIYCYPFNCSIHITITNNIKVAKLIMHIINPKILIEAVWSLDIEKDILFVWFKMNKNMVQLLIYLFIHNMCRIDNYS